MKENKNNLTTSHPVRRWGNCLIYALLFTLISFLADQSNLFGFSSLISDQNERIYQRLTAGSYGGKSPRGQSKLAVMLYTDNATRLEGMGWPMKYDALAEQIEDVEMAGARGIFVDMVFRGSGRDRGAFCRLIQTMANVSGRSLPSEVDGADCLELVPMYQQKLRNSEFSSGENWPLKVVGDTTGKDAFPNFPADSKRKLLLVGASLEYLNAREELRKCPEKVSCEKASDTFINAMDAWPATFVIDHVAQLVPLSVGAVDGKAVHLSVDKARHVSPALQVVRHLKSEYLNVAGEFEFISKDSTLEDLLYLRWGNKVAEKQEYAKPFQQFGGCPGLEGGFLKRLRSLAIQIFPQSGGDRNLTARCPYHLTIDMADYHNNVKIPSSAESQFKRFGFSMLKDLVDERFVLIGMSMDRLADTVESPVHGKIAGIYAHAMAIDNLLEYGNGFFRAYQPDPDAPIQSDPIMMLLQYLLTGVLALLFLRYGDDIRDFFIKGQLNSSWNVVGLTLTLLFIGVLLISVLALESLNWLDWLLVLVLAIGFSYTALIFFGPRLIYKVRTKNPDFWIGQFEEEFRERNAGMKNFLPLIALMSIMWLILALLGVIVGYFSNADPINFLFIFLSLSTLLVLALNNELFGGFATFLVGKSIAKEFY